MNSIVNISSYQFAPLNDLPELRKSLRQHCKELDLRGTILLSPEGINLFLAGERDSIDSILDHVRKIPGLSDLSAKESFTDYQPFRRLLVKIKKEIITFDIEKIDPANKTSPKLSAETLKQWLDEGKQVTLLDVRNDYEVRLGTFEKATPIGIDHFRQFPEAIKTLPTNLKEQPVVMFCTGGIRCEKAGPFMEREGFKQIYQLDGGILKYFELCQGKHYEGDCFVFDQRVSVDRNLHETSTTQCYACQEPLTALEQQPPKYVFGKSCPYCYQSEQEMRAVLINKRNQAIEKLSNPLPGSVAYDNYRPLNVPGRFDGYLAIDFLVEYHPQIDRAEWEEVFQLGQIIKREGPVLPDEVVTAGQRLERVIPATIEPEVNPAIEVLYEDEALVVINKPAPLPMHPSGRFNRNTLSYFLQQTITPWQLRQAHRLDANTTGVVVFATTRHFARKVHSQFKQGNVKKCYLAKIQGYPTEDTFFCDASISQQPDKTGTRIVDQQGVPARTEFEVIQRFDDNTTLLKAFPLTGRTNQIRVHLWHLNMPVCGDPAYLPNQKIGNQQTLNVSDPPLCLHARSISLIHPLTGQPITFEAPSPAWAVVADTVVVDTVE